MIHTPTFDVDEACLELGVRAMTDALLDAGARWDELAETLEA
jgi:metal-dependent amidase/aminoacylase/carboxypeptidase family protein